MVFNILNATDVCRKHKYVLYTCLNAWRRVLRLANLLSKTFGLKFFTPINIMEYDHIGGGHRK